VRVRYPHLSDVESFSLVRHDDGSLLAEASSGTDVYFCSWMIRIAVHNAFPELEERPSHIETLAGAHCDLSSTNQQASPAVRCLNFAWHPEVISRTEEDTGVFLCETALRMDDRSGSHRSHDE